MLASGSAEGTIILWDVATGQPLSPPLTGHTAEVWGLAFSPDGQTLASGSYDDTIILWDVATGQPLGPPLTSHTGFVYKVAFSPDGQTLASGSADGTIILWDVATGQPRGSPLTGHKTTVLGVAFSPDTQEGTGRTSGQMLASGGGDGAIILWDIVTRQPLGLPLTGHTTALYSVAFSPDGQTLVSGAFEDKTVILWDMSLESWKGRACRRANRNLTHEEWQQFFGDQPYRATCPDLPAPKE
jgi:WD40 repeat protein